MDRRASLKTLALTAFSGGLLLNGCKPDVKNSDGATLEAIPDLNYDRTPEELAQHKKLTTETFFTAQELATITVLADIIIPADEVSGSASDAKVPEFIEFIVKDQPQHQTPLRGGLRWLNLQSVGRFGKAFQDCTSEQRLALVNDIAFPEKARPEMKAGVAFFNLMRNLTATGFYTSKLGIEDLGYKGNTPNQWNGVPADVLAQYGLSYTEKELSECVRFDK